MEDAECNEVLEKIRTQKELIFIGAVEKVLGKELTHSDCDGLVFSVRVDDNTGKDYWAMNDEDLVVFDELNFDGYDHGETKIEMDLSIKYKFIGSAK